MDFKIRVACTSLEVCVQYPMIKMGIGKIFLFGVLCGLVHKCLEPQFDGSILLSVIGNAHIGDIALILAQLI